MSRSRQRPALAGDRKARRSCLRIEIDRQHPVAAQGEILGKMRGSRRLAGPPLKFMTEMTCSLSSAAMAYIAWVFPAAHRVPLNSL